MSQKNKVGRLTDIPTDDKCKKIKHYIGMLIIGALNNLPYWVALSSAQSIVIHFDSSGLLGAITWGCVLLGMGATSTNTFLSQKNVSYNIRSVANGCFMAFGLIGTALAPNIYVAIASIMLVGLSSDFGEGVMLGYFASTGDDSLMNSWGIGTGISGVLGSGYAFICQLFNIPYKTSFLSLAPAGIAYPLCFIFLLDAGKNTQTAIPGHEDLNTPLNNQDDDNINNEGNNIEELETIEGPMEEDMIDEDEEVSQSAAPIHCCSCALWKNTIWFFLNNGATFFAQYVAISGFADCSMTQQQKIDKPWIYGMLNLIYQVGNLAGRATLQWFRTPYILALTLIQLGLAVFWFFNVIFRYLPLWGQIFINFLIGVNGGLSYVNIFNQTMNYPGVSPKIRELMTNLTSISIAGFIVVSSAFTLLMQNTFFKTQCTGM